MWDQLEKPSVAMAKVSLGIGRFPKVVRAWISWSARCHALVRWQSMKYRMLRKQYGWIHQRVKSSMVFGRGSG
jgi:hypothetical protein